MLESIYQEILSQRMDKPVILIVDDEVEVLQTMRDNISTSFRNIFDIETAQDAEEGLDVIQDLVDEKKQIAVIISDYNLMKQGKEQGDDFLIEAHKLVPDAKKILITGAALHNDIDQALVKTTRYANLYRYLKKPWDVEDLVLTIEEACKSFLSQLVIQNQNQDLTTIYEVSQTISKHQKLNELLDILTRKMLDLTGAERVMLILKKDQDWIVSSEGDSEGIRVGLHQPLHQSDKLPVNIVRNIAAESNPQILLLKNALEDPNYQIDPYIQYHSVKSVLVAPLMEMGKLNGIIYLENRNKEDAFTPEKLSIIKILTTQASISIENSTMFEHLEEEVRKKTSELFEKNKRLEYQNQQKEEMIRIVSHDIRSPVTGIKGLAELLTESSVASKHADV
ncbi:MAG: GAF domain-containing protein, partial [Bacteroidia bacterium]|nr:GAF domain-containing protein [Bacteroidia bacterium]